MQLQLVTAAVKLFLKNPQPRAQQMIQLVLTYATQVHPVCANPTHALSYLLCDDKQIIELTSLTFFFVKSGKSGCLCGIQRPCLRASVHTPQRERHPRF